MLQKKGERRKFSFAEEWQLINEEVVREWEKSPFRNGQCHNWFRQRLSMDTDTIRGHVVEDQDSHKVSTLRLLRNFTGGSMSLLIETSGRCYMNQVIKQHHQWWDKLICASWGDLMVSMQHYLFSILWLKF